MGERERNGLRKKPVNAAHNAIPFLGQCQRGTCMACGIQRAEQNNCPLVARRELRHNSNCYVVVYAVCQNKNQLI